MPVLIKRYSNRKLYHTGKKRYVSLNEVAGLVRQGEDIRIIYNDTGEDLTTSTLAQIIMEQEKKTGDFLPGELLSGLIQAGGSPVANLRRRMIGPLALRRWVDEELSYRIDCLVERKELTRAEGSRLLVRLIQAGQAAEEPTLIERIIEKYLEDYGVPTRELLLEFTAQIDELEEQLERTIPQA